MLNACSIIVEQMAIRLLQIELDNPRWLALREDGLGRTCVLLLALLHICATSLHNESAEKSVVGQNFARLDLVRFNFFVFQRLFSSLLLKLLLHLAKMPRKRMNAKWCGFEVVGLPLGKQLNHVLQVKQSIVDWRCGEEINVLAFADIEESPSNVTRAGLDHRPSVRDYGSGGLHPR